MRADAPNADPESAKSIPMVVMDHDMGPRTFDAPVAFSQDNNAQVEVEMRTDFPETWLWQMEEIE